MTHNDGDNNRRKAIPTQCRCGVWVLDGLDDDVCAFSARAELSPLTTAGTYAAHYLGRRRVYQLILGKLWRRTHIGPTDAPVLAQHVCGQPLPDSWLADLPPPLTVHLPDKPPY